MQRGGLSMQAYEFYAKPKDGVIAIPEQYINQITDNVMVIILDKNPITPSRKDAKPRKKTDVLSPPSIKTKGWKFDREVANER